MRRLWYVMWKELLELRRDPRLFGVIFIAPVVQLTMLGYAASTDVRDVPVVTVDPGQMGPGICLFGRLQATTRDRCKRLDRRSASQRHRQRPSGSDPSQRSSRYPCQTMATCDIATVAILGP